MTRRGTDRKGSNALAGGEEEWGGEVLVVKVAKLCLRENGS